VLAAGDAGLRGRDERLTLPTMGPHHLDEAASVVGASRQRDGVVRREPRRS